MKASRKRAPRAEPDEPRMSFRDACDLVPDDLPDGAYFALAHEIAGLEYGDGFDELVEEAGGNIAPLPEHELIDLGKKLRKTLLRMDGARRIPVASAPSQLLKLFGRGLVSFTGEAFLTRQGEELVDRLKVSKPRDRRAG